MTAIAFGGSNSANATTKYAITENGEAWEAFPNPVEGLLTRIRGAATDGSRIVAVGNYQLLMYSDDGGATWTQSAVPSGAPADIMDVAYDGAGRWTAVGGSAWIGTSTDGATWTTVSHSLPGWNLNTAVHHADGLWVLGRDGSGLNGDILATSPDGTTWTVRASSLQDAPGGAHPVVEDITHDGAKWWAVAWGQYATSPDGVSWTRHIGPLGVDEYLGGIAHDGQGTIVVAGQGGKNARSTDGGAGWSVGEAVVHSKTWDLVWCGSVFAMVGEPYGAEDPALYLSTDGQTWSHGFSLGTYESGGVMLGMVITTVVGEIVVPVAPRAARAINARSGGPRVVFE